MSGYTAVAYQTVSGRVMYDIDLAADPSWAVTLNGSADSWQVQVPLTSRAAANVVREWAERGFGSVAIMWDDVVCQAGPITQVPEIGEIDGMPVAIVTGKGFWENLNQRVLHERSWDPATGITSPTADLSVTNSLGNIGITIVFHATTMVNRPGSTLPFDIAALDPAGGSNVRNYRGYEKASAGQRLQELTQVENGPDIYFRPYMTTIGGFRYIRHTMLVGTPYLLQGGDPPLFDLNSSIEDIWVGGDSSPMVTTAFVTGTGNEAGQMNGYATSTSLTDKGWPLMDYVDSGHASTSIQETLDSWARADVAQYSRKLEQWKPRVRLDADPRWGTYIPGHFGRYVLNDHPWIPDGAYTSRILGVASAGVSADDVPLIEHQIEAIPQ